MDGAFARIIADSLRFEYLDSGVTQLDHAHTTGWRVLPGMMCSQIYHGEDRMLLEGNVVIPVPAGSLMLLAAGIPHCINMLAPSGLSRWAHVNYYIHHHLDLFSLLDVPPVAPPALGHAVGEAIAEWVAEDQREDVDALWLSARRQEFGFHLLGLLSRVCRLKPDAAERVEQRHRLRRVIDYMHAHFRQPIERDDLAKLACLSPAQFHRTFHHVTGITPVAYLRQVRLRQAQQRLLTTTLSIADIAEQVGFTDLFVFSKSFKRHCGISPSEYRATLRELRG